MKRIKLLLTGLTLLLIGLNLQVSYAANGPGVYAASILYTTPDAANELRQSGFDWVCVWTLHIYPDGHLVLNSETNLTENGAFNATQENQSFANTIASLKTAPTSINWIEFGLSGWGSGSFDAVRDLVASEGTGPGSSLYENFKALRDAIPEIDAFSIDDENTYHEPSTTQLAIMLADLGFKVSVCPYTQVSHWQNVVANTNTARPGTIEDVHLQCYAGGAGNNPCTWDGYFAPEINVMPGVEPGSVASKMANWNNQCGITGGWIWAYDSYYGQTSVVQGWASDIANNISGGTPPPPTANNVAPDATVTVSSEYTDPNWSKEKITDGISGQNGNGEWASNGESTPWAQLNWSQGVVTSKVILYERPNLTEGVTSGTLTFSDGSSVSVGALPNNGAAQEVTFSERTVSWVKFKVDQGTGPNNGLAEFEVVGYYGGTSTNLAPDASISVSSEYFDPNWSKEKITDGISGQNATGEWASNGEVTPWAQLNWSQDVVTSKIVLYDRPNSYDHIASGTLTFSDGSSVSVGSLPDDGVAETITFSERTITWVKLEVTSGDGPNNGLSEFEVFGEYVTSNESNLAPDATISVSSEYTDPNWSKEKITDGISGQNATGEWASNGEITPWAQLNWTQDVVTSKIVLYDRPNSYDHIASGTLTFSDGSSVSVGSLPDDGAAETITFSERTVTWVKLQVNSGDGPNNGLSEFEVMGNYSSALKSSQESSSIQEENASGLKVYPNPVNDYFIVELPDEGRVSIEIIDLTGRLVYKNFFNGTLTINTSDINRAGLLLIKVRNGNNIYVEKLMVSRK